MAAASPYCAQTEGDPRRSRSWTSANEWTSSTAAAAGKRLSGRAPSASPVARQSTGRTRLPPSPCRIGSASVLSSGVSASSSRYPSTSVRSSLGARGIGIRLGAERRGLRLGRALGALQLRLDRLRQVGELLQDLDRLVRVVGLVQARARLLEPRQQVFCIRQRFVRGHLPAPRAGKSRHL